MEKIILIAVLLALAVVLGAALCGKNIVDFLRGAKLKDIKIPNVKIADKNRFVAGFNGSGDTLVPTALYMYQLNKDGSCFYRHDISYKQMSDAEGNMVGISVSHPGAKSDGILLHGETDRLGRYKQNHESTYAALTVNTDAFYIGNDEKGFYGEVTNAKAKVYTVDENSKLQLIPYGKTFNIEHKTYILVGHQWLYFEIPELPVFPSFSSSSYGDTVFYGAVTTADVPGFTGKPEHGMGKRNGAHKQKKDTPAVKNGNSSADRRTVTYSFPLDD